MTALEKLHTENHPVEVNIKGIDKFKIKFASEILSKNKKESNEHRVPYTTNPVTFNARTFLCYWLL